MTTLATITALAAVAGVLAVRTGWLDRITGGTGEPTTWRTAVGNTATAVGCWIFVAFVLASCHAPLPKGWL